MVRTVEKNRKSKAVYILKKQDYNPGRRIRHNYMKKLKY